MRRARYPKQTADLLCSSHSFASTSSPLRSQLLAFFPVVEYPYFLTPQSTMKKAGPTQSLVCSFMGASLP